MKIAIGCDEAAYSLKMEIIKHLRLKYGTAIEADDFGANKGEVVLYPDVAQKVAEQVAGGHYDRGILICGTGIGMCMTANKVPGIRAAVCHDPYSAERSRKSNDAQIMCMGERVIGVELAKYIVDIWLGCDFDGGRSTAKVQRMKDIEMEYRETTSIKENKA